MKLSKKAAEFLVAQDMLVRGLNPNMSHMSFETGAALVKKGLLVKVPEYMAIPMCPAPYNYGNGAPAGWSRKYARTVWYELTWKGVEVLASDTFVAPPVKSWLGAD